VSAQNLTHDMIDPQYVQIRRKEAAFIVGVSIAEFDKLRKVDPACPKGFRNGKGRNSPVMFRLSDVYRYSEHRMRQSESVA